MAVNDDDHWRTISRKMINMYVCVLRLLSRLKIIFYISKYIYIHACAYAVSNYLYLGQIIDMLTENEVQLSEFALL